MPTWICPECSASHNVSAKHIGKSGKCQKCGESSVVIDSTASDDDVSPNMMAAIFSDDAVATPAKIPSPGQEKQPMAPTTIAKAVLATFLVILAFCAFASLIEDSLSGMRSTLWLGLIVFGIQITLAWPFYSACDDLRTIRERTPRQ